MEVRTKIRALNWVKVIFPEWAIRLQARVVYAAFDDELAQARDGEAREHVRSQRAFETSEYWDELRTLRSDRLIKQAHELYVSTEGLIWITGNFGHKYLDGPSESELKRAVRDQKHKIWEFRIKILTALTGLIGTIIGLVSIWKA